MASLHNLSLDRETTCILSAVALFSTQSISQSQLTVPLENFRKHQYGFALLVSLSAFLTMVFMSLEMNINTNISKCFN